MASRRLVERVRLRATRDEAFGSCQGDPSRGRGQPAGLLRLGGAADAKELTAVARDA